MRGEKVMTTFQMSSYKGEKVSDVVTAGGRYRVLLFYFFVFSSFFFFCKWEVAQHVYEQMGMIPYRGKNRQWRREGIIKELESLNIWEGMASILQVEGEMTL